MKFIYSEKATKFCEIFPLLLTICIAVKSKGKISQNFVAFSEYMKYNIKIRLAPLKKKMLHPDLAMSLPCCHKCAYELDKTFVYDMNLSFRWDIQLLSCFFH